METVNEHTHRHTHTEEEKKAVLNRLARASGHLESVRRMIENDRDCAEVLVQMAAVRSAITNAAKVLLQEHIEHCMVDAVKYNDMERIQELNKAIERFL